MKSLALKNQKINMYEPEVDDYVVWDQGVYGYDEGWVAARSRSAKGPAPPPPPGPPPPQCALLQRVGSHHQQHVS